MSGFRTTIYEQHHSPGGVCTSWARQGYTIDGCIHWLMGAGQMGRALPKTLPGLQRFYVAGQWVEPGGGVSTVTGSGRQAVQILCRDSGRLYLTSLRTIGKKTR